MQNVEDGKARKAVEKKKHLQVVYLLKEFDVVPTITKYILDSKVNLTMGELLASAPDIEK